jgi:hypothetical protein
VESLTTDQTEEATPLPSAGTQESVPAPAAVSEIVIIENISTLERYITLMAEATKPETRQWFRGTRRSEYDLEPSLYRHPIVRDANALIELEWALLSDFRHRAPPFTTNIPTKDLEVLFLMQHFGVPTRLLDWSESPFVALFFALENARLKGSDAHDSSVWILNPIGLNSLAADLREGSNQVYGAYADELGGYQPRSEGRKVTERLPSALYGIHNSPRIVAQRGTFVIFGNDTTPMNKHPKLTGPDGIIRRIDIDKKAKGEMFAALTRMGVSDSVIYPDLDGLGREIKNHRGF